MKRADAERIHNQTSTLFVQPLVFKHVLSPLPLFVLKKTKLQDLANCEPRTYLTMLMLANAEEWIHVQYIPEKKQHVLENSGEKFLRGLLQLQN